MRNRTKAVVAAVVVGAAALGTAGAVSATRGDDRDVDITGPDLDRATAAALAHTGGGRVTGTEVGDEDSYSEVEVTLDDGRAVDVQLDERFAVVDTTSDTDTAEDSGS